MACEHELYEMETLCADGLCPICLAETNGMLRRQIKRLRAALMKIAAYDDKGACEHLAKTGSFSRFDEPGSVQAARRALQE